MITRRSLVTICLLALAIISLALVKTHLNDSREDVASLKSVSINHLKSAIKRSNHIPYEQIYDVGQRVDYQKPPIDWTKDFTENRSANFYLHSWDMINGRLIDYEKDHDKRHFNEAMSVAIDWISHNKVSYVNNQKKTFAWYDMAVGVRAYRLAYILDQAIRSGTGSDSDYRLLWNSLVDHIIYLDNDENIIFHNNHGVYEAAGQKALARRFSPVSEVFKSVERQADYRLERMISSQFTDEGIHKEHSPDYHRMVYQTFLVLRNEGLLDGKSSKILAKAGNAMYWMIKPDGTLVNFGDSDYRKISRSTGEYGNESKTLLYYLTEGNDGSRPSSGLKTFSDSGLGVVKLEQSYLAQEAAFFSRTHKHADDLTFSWYEGRDILIDSGKYGYKGKTDPKSADALAGFWYSDPKRQYVESTRAHNTVEIDGMNYLRRGREPFGSAIVDSGRVAENIYFIRTKVTEFKTITYDRTLIYSPGKWLAVVDDLKDSESKTRDYKQWFQFAPDLEISRAGKEVVVRNVGKTALRGVSLLEGPSPAKPISGQKTPRLQGWYSQNANHFQPTTSVSFDQSGEGAEFVTLFAFSGSPVSFEAHGNTIEEFSWTMGGTKYVLSIDKNATNTRVNYQTK